MNWNIYNFIQLGYMVYDASHITQRGYTFEMKCLLIKSGLLHFTFRETVVKRFIIVNFNWYQSLMSDRDPSPWLSMKHAWKGFINVNHNWFQGFIYDRVCISLDNYFPRNVCRVYRCKFSFWQSPWPRSGPPGAPAVSPVGWGDRPELVNQTETLTLSWRANTRFRMSRNATKTLVQMVNCP